MEGTDQHIFPREKVRVIRSVHANLICHGLSEYPGLLVGFLYAATYVHCYLQKQGAYAPIKIKKVYRKMILLTELSLAEQSHPQKC